GEMAKTAQPAPRRHRRARGRAGGKAHRLLARGGGDRLCGRPAAFRAGGRCRPCRIVHHLGGDPGRRRGAAVGVPARRRARGRGRAAPRRRPQMRPLVEDLTFRRARSAISRRDAARRAGAARMGRHAQGGGVGGGVADASPGLAARSYAWGPLSALGLAVAVATGVIDQASKLWLLDVFDLADRGRVAVTPFIDLVITWNNGISYQLLQQKGLFGAWALLAFKMAAVAFLWIWLARASSRLTGCTGPASWISCFFT